MISSGRGQDRFRRADIPGRPVACSAPVLTGKPRSAGTSSVCCSTQSNPSPLAPVQITSLGALGQDDRRCARLAHREPHIVLSVRYHIIKTDSVCEREKSGRVVPSDCTCALATSSPAHPPAHADTLPPGRPTPVRFGEPFRWA